MSAQDKSEIMRAMRARRKKQGLAQVQVWIPADQVPRLRQYAAKLVAAARGVDK